MGGKARIAYLVSYKNVTQEKWNPQRKQCVKGTICNVEAQVFNGETCAYECFKVHQSPHYVGKNTGGDGYDAPILYKTIIFAHITHFCVQI